MAVIPATSPRADNPAPLRDVQVLIVEDQADTRSALLGLFQNAGAKAIGVDNVDAALKAVHDHKPDVLVSDIGLPGEDGHALIRRIRLSEKSASTVPLPAIALTAFARDIDEKIAIAAGFNQYFAKPVDGERLVDAVRELLARE